MISLLHCHIACCNTLRYIAGWLQFDSQQMQIKNKEQTGLPCPAPCSGLGQVYHPLCFPTQPEPASELLQQKVGVKILVSQLSKAEQKVVSASMDHHRDYFLFLLQEER